MPPHPDLIAECVLSTFRALPTKYKPRHTPLRREWVPLAGIVVSRTDSPHLTCISLSTGMKCLPAHKLPLAQGNILHDWHAETLALRGLNRFILDACGRGDEFWVEKGREGGRRWRLSGRVEGVYMYCSEAPCGDASMELTMAGVRDRTPWGDVGEGMQGRGGFGRLGVVRRKPARGDAPVCLSKSCSDKLGLKQVLGVLGAVVSLVVEGVWLKGVVLPEGRCVRGAVERAWGREGRMKGSRLSGDAVGYEYRSFEVWTTSKTFEFDKVEDAVASNLAIMWTPQRQEILINGVLQGRKQDDPRGRSSASRRSMWEDVKALNIAELENVLSSASYADIKASHLLQSRETAKRDIRTSSLSGWEQNTGDEQWGIT